METFAFFQAALFFFRYKQVQLKIIVFEICSAGKYIRTEAACLVFNRKLNGTNKYNQQLIVLKFVSAENTYTT